MTVHKEISSDQRFSNKRKEKGERIFTEFQVKNLFQVAVFKNN